MIVLTIQNIQKLGKCALLAKPDLENDYKQISIRDDSF